MRNDLPFLALIFSLFLYKTTCAQTGDVSLLPKLALEQKLDVILNNKKLSSESLVESLQDINSFPNLSAYVGQRILTIHISTFGSVPFKLYIPATYNSHVASPLILLLHGAVSQSSFELAKSSGQELEKDDDPFYISLCQRGYIVIKPYGDSKKQFSWVSNKFGVEDNFTFDVLTKVVCELKKSINIDDNKVFAFGHSDGSDGTFALSVFKPNLFAGFIAYNSMLTNLFTQKIHLKNAVNRPLYIVHSDKDDLRPINQTRAIVKLLDSLKVKINYKEYFGYTHEDLHLKKDFPRSLKFIDTTKRNPYPKILYWETSSHLFEECDWLVIKKWNLALKASDWHKSYNLPNYDKIKQVWRAYPITILNQVQRLKAFMQRIHLHFSHPE